MFLRKNAAGEGKDRCDSCILNIDYCLECENENKCTKCQYDYFGIVGGKCSCKTGDSSFYNVTAKECQCNDGLIRTTRGCLDLQKEVGETCTLTETVTY